MALNNINSNGEEQNVSQYWTSNSTDVFDIPDITNYTSVEGAITDMNGRKNTDIILSYALANSKIVQAATSTDKYAPSVCAGGTFCGEGKWYLPALGELYIMRKN